MIALALTNWRKIALGLGVVALLASYAATYRAGHNAATSDCEARIGDAEREALRKAGEATQQQRARAEALEIANQTLQEQADAILSQPRDACPLDRATIDSLRSIRP